MGDSLNEFFQQAGGAGGKALDRLFGKKQEIPTNGAGKQRGGPPNLGFTEPDGRLSDVIKDIPGVHKSATEGLTEDNGSGERKQQPGFTPINYYRTETGEIFINPDPSFVTTTQEKAVRDKIVYSFGDSGIDEFKFGLDYLSPVNSEKNARESFDGSFNAKSWEKVLDPNPTKLAAFVSTPEENEDPVYFGFEIVIDSINSPLINGEVEKFINTIGSNYKEVKSREEIIKSFKWELGKYFKFNSPIEEESNIFKSFSERFHYIKKIQGLDKLSEANTAKESKSFVKYRDDVIRISFYEDSQLSTGSLASLYKLLYWSKSKGKGIIPENLLRFDCQIIVSEVRNIARVRKALGSANNLEVLRENISRYVYSAYECQFYFPQMTHPSDVDIGSPIPDSSSYNWDVEMSFKFSDMRFERFVFGENFGKYRHISNSQDDPLELKPKDANAFGISNGSIVLIQNPISPLKTEPTVTGLSGDSESDVESSANSTTQRGANISLPDTPAESQSSELETLKQNNKVNIYQSTQVPKPLSEEVPGDKSLLAKTGEKLLQNLKKAALDEAQRQLNNQFRLLNNSLDKIRNSFGVGRMSAPTNVYDNPTAFGINSRFFFDVQNSLRGFTGDFLLGVINKK